MSLSSETVRLWVNEFKCGKTSIEGTSHSVLVAVTPETIDDVHDMVSSDRQVKVCGIAEATGISTALVTQFIGAILAKVHRASRELCRKNKGLHDTN